MNDAGLITVVDRLLSATTKSEAEAFVKTLGDAYKGLASRILTRLTFKRTLSQNNILHVWFQKIADFHGDRNATSVKGEMHHMFALDIRLRDPQFSWIWQRTGAILEYEKQCSLLASESLNVSSAMTTKELREYMDAIQAHYAEQGLSLEVSHD